MVRARCRDRAWHPEANACSQRRDHLSGEKRRLRQPVTETDIAMPLPSDRLRLALSLAACACAAAVVAGTVGMVVRGWTAVPYADQWWNLLSRHDLTLTWLFAQHNEHRIAVPRLLFALDHAAFGETFKLELACNILVQSAGAALLIAGFQGASTGSRPYRFVVAGLVVAVLFSAMQYENFLWGFQIQFFGVCIVALGAISAMAQVRSERIAFALFAGLSTVATFSLASGLLCGYVAAAVCILRRRSRAMLGGVCLVSALLTAAYLHGYISPPYHSDPVETVKHPLRLAAYSAVELGSVFPPLLGHWSVLGAAIMGGLGDLLFVVVGAVLVRRRRDASGAEIAAFGIAAFALAMTLVTAMGRLGPEVVPAFTSRYTTPAGLFWLGLALAGLSIAARRHTRIASALSVLFTLWAGALAFAQPRFIGPALAEKRALAAVAPALLAGVGDTDMLHRTDPFDTGKPIQWRDALKATRTSVFAPAWTRLTGADLAATGGEPCGQADVEVTRIDAPLHPGWRITGRLTHSGIDGREPHILLVAGDGRVVGFGIGGFDAASVGRGEADPSTVGPWWIGETTEDPAGLQGRVIAGGGVDGCVLSF